MLVVVGVIDCVEEALGVLVALRGDHTLRLLIRMLA